jgi:hypothetical protein
MRMLFIIICVLLQKNIIAQCVNCTNNIIALEDTLKKYYVGFPLIDTNSVSYVTMKKRILRAAINLPVNLSCYRLLREYSLYFNDLHLAFGFNFLSKKDSLFFKNDNHLNQKLLKMQTNSFEVLSKKDIDYFTGKWVDDRDVNVEIKIRNKKVALGYLRTEDGKHWFKNDLRFFIYKKGGKYFANYLARDHFSYENEVQLYENEFAAGMYLRLFKDDNYFTNPDKFIFKAIDSNTNYIKVQNCTISNTKLFDSLVKVNHNLLTSKQDLIIDFRNNTGGSIYLLYPLLPYIADSWLYRFGAKVRSNEITQGYAKQYQNNATDSATKKHYLDLENAMKINKDAYYELFEGYHMQQDTVYEYPKRVFILVNRKTFSAPEIFCELLKGASKVITVGEPTAGGISLTDWRNFDLPCKSIRVNTPFNISNMYDKYKDPGHKFYPDFIINAASRDWIKIIKNIYK